MVPAPSYVQAPAFQPRPLADGALLRTLGSCALGDFIGIGWKGTRDRRIFSQASMLLRRSGTNLAFAGVENLSALPIGTPPRKRPEISHGGCHMVGRKNGLSEGPDKPLI